MKTFPGFETSPRSFFIHDLIDVNNQLELYEDKLKPKKAQKKNKIKKLAKAYNDGNLVFVLGSGICIPRGIPDWDTLLQRLLIKIKFANTDSEVKSELLAEVFNQVFSPNQLIAARYIKKHCERNDRISFEGLIKSTLYEGLNQKSNSLFKEILPFCVVGKGPRIDCIITYNFDDLIEQYFDDNKKTYCSIYFENINGTRKKFPIYHVHGFLPQNDLSNNSNLVLSEDVYHDQYNEIYNWRNLLQINKFTEKTCLFIGFSLEDPNSRRLLDIAAKQRGTSKTAHFIIRKKIDPAEVEIKLKCLLEKDNNLFHEKVQQGFKFNDLVKRIVSLQRNFLEEDALSFGIDTIWVDDYGDIPTLLSELRRDNLRL